MTWTEGDFWSEQRRFTLRHLLELGFGKTSSENLIQDEFFDLEREFLAEAASNPDGIVDFGTNRFGLSVMNILWAIVAGKRFQHDDARLHKLIHAVSLMFKSTSILQRSLPIPDFLLNVLPLFLRKHLGSIPQVFNPLADFIKVDI